jgi:putative glycosyltransferase
LRLLLDALTSFTSYPLHAVFVVGATISLSAGLFGVGLIIKKLLRPDTILLGWSSLMASIWLLGGLTIGSIGLIGLYVSRIFAETKRRPQYIVREVQPARGTGANDRVEPSCETELSWRR